MRLVFFRASLPLAALAAVSVIVSSCASNAEAERLEAARLAAEAEALAARTPPPIALSADIAQAASIYTTFIREAAAVRGGFADAAAIQAALAEGASYDPEQLSRGLVAYAAIVALQSPEFVAGVRQYGGDVATRQKLIADIVRDPRYASYLPGADAGAGLVMATLNADIGALLTAAESVENDAYSIQERYDPRRAWAVAHISDRESRLLAAKAASAQTMLPSSDEAARLFASAMSGSGLGVSADRPRTPPYPPAVTNALAIAALAALGAAGDGDAANIAGLRAEPVNRGCLADSKLNLYQCLAASRPSYEDMFCLGRHVVRDLATCTQYSAMPIARISVSDPRVTGVAAPAIDAGRLFPERQSTAPAAPAIRSAPLTPGPTVAPAPVLTPTQRLNAQPTLATPN